MSNLLYLTSSFDKALNVILNATDKEDLSNARDHIFSVEPSLRRDLWDLYFERKEVVSESDETFRNVSELKELAFDDFLFGENRLSREEEFDLARNPDFEDFMAYEKELNIVSNKHLLFLHTVKQLRKNAVKTKNYSNFSFIISWVFDHKTWYNYWELKHIFRTHKELKKMFFSDRIKAIAA